jgi:hypothetical protein
MVTTGDSVERGEASFNNDFVLFADGFESFEWCQSEKGSVHVTGLAGGPGQSSDLPTGPLMIRCFGGPCQLWTEDLCQNTRCTWVDSLLAEYLGPQRARGAV